MGYSLNFLHTDEPSQHKRLTAYLNAAHRTYKARNPKVSDSNTALFMPYLRASYIKELPTCLQQGKSRLSRVDHHDQISNMISIYLQTLTL